MSRPILPFVSCVGMAVLAASAQGQSFCEPVTADTLVNPTVLGNGTPGSVTTAAIQNALNAGGHIRFNVGSSATTIALDSTLVINRAVVLDGAGVVTLSGSNARRIVQITNPQNQVYAITLQNISFANGSTPSARGAAIYSDPAGGIWQAVSLKLVNCGFSDNAAMASGQDDGGGALYATGMANVRIGNCTFTNNRGSNGGAVYTLGTRSVTIVDSLFTGNQATGTGGNPGNGGNAGAFGVDGADRQVDVCRTRFVSNTSNTHGAGFFSVMYDATSRSRFEDTTFDGNRQLATTSHTGGAYIQGGPFAFERATFVNNEAQGFGGLFVGPGASGTIRNATFAGNVARQGLGGALRIDQTADVSIINTTIADNSAPGANAFAGGISVTPSNLLRLTNVVLANNTGGNAFNPWNIQNPASEDGGGNMQWPQTRPNGGAETRATPSTTFADPLLAASAGNNGGFVQTIALTSASPARDSGVSGAEVPALDARGVARVGVPDRGSYEFTPESLSIDDRSVAEGADSAASFRVVLVPASPNTVTVAYATSAGTAQAGSDYVAVSGTLTLTPGRTVHSIPVPILTDGILEGNETFTVTLSNAVNATIGDASAVGTIGDPPAAAHAAMYRAYNRGTDYHFFTTDLGSKNFAVNVLGFQDESTPVPFYVSNVQLAGTVPLFRMYNPNLGRHFYTASSGSRDFIMSIGGVYEKDEGFLYPLSTSPVPSGATELFLLYNNNSGTHLFTADANQKNAILGLFPGVWVQHTSVGYVFTSP